MFAYGHMFKNSTLLGFCAPADRQTQVILNEPGAGIQHLSDLDLTQKMSRLTVKKCRYCYGNIFKNSTLVVTSRNDAGFEIFDDVCSFKCAKILAK